MAKPFRWTMQENLSPAEPKMSPPFPLGSTSAQRVAAPVISCYASLQTGLGAIRVGAEF